MKIEDKKFKFAKAFSMNHYSERKFFRVEKPHENF